MANKVKKCSYCKEKKEIEITTPIYSFCSFNCASSMAQNKQAKQKQKQIAKAKQSVAKKEKAARADLRARKEKLKTAGDYIKEAQAAVNKYIRLRDHGKPCISCGAISEQKFGGTMEAGHWRSRGSASHLRFNLLNINLQCSRCNRYLSGNPIPYRVNLIKKIGLEQVEDLENDNKPRKFTIEYLKRVKKIFSKRARYYEKRIARR